MEGTPGQADCTASFGKPVTLRKITECGTGLCMVSCRSDVLPTPGCLEYFTNLAQRRYRVDSFLSPLRFTIINNPPYTECMSSGTKPRLLHLETRQHPPEAAVVPESFSNLVKGNSMVTWRDSEPWTTRQQLSLQKFLLPCHVADIVYVENDKTIIIMQLQRYHSTPPMHLPVFYPGRPLEVKEFRPHLLTVEIGALGHWRTRRALPHITCSPCSPNLQSEYSWTILGRLPSHCPNIFSWQGGKKHSKRFGLTSFEVYLVVKPLVVFAYFDLFVLLHPCQDHPTTGVGPCCLE